MKLFQYAILYHPLPKEKETGAQSKIVKEITTIIAHDLNAATLIAARSIPEDYTDKMERIEVAVRPF